MLPRTPDYLLYTRNRLGDELYGLVHRRYRRQLWSLAKTRKKHTCAITGKVIEKGSLAYRPITNAGKRYERIAQSFFEDNR